MTLPRPKEYVTKKLGEFQRELRVAKARPLEPGHLHCRREASAKSRIKSGLPGRFSVCPNGTFMSDSIKIIVNGKEETCPAGTSVSDYLRAKGVDAAQVAAEHNGVILKPESFALAALKEGDSIEFIRFVGGG